MIGPGSLWERVLEKLNVVFKEYGKALQVRGGGVVVSADDVVEALVKADDPIKRDSWSGMAVLRRRECEPVSVWFLRTVWALLKPYKFIDVGR